MTTLHPPATGVLARVRPAPDLVLTLTATHLQIASPRWEPGLFVYDLEFVRLELRPTGQGSKLRVAARGAHVDFQVLRATLDGPATLVVETFLRTLDRARTALIGLALDPVRPGRALHALS